MPQSQSHVSTQKEAQGEIATIHKPFLSWLHKNNLLFVYHRPDKRSGIASGWPDFTICHCGRCLLVEAKTEKGRLSPKQEQCHAKLRDNGNPVYIARSASEAIWFVKTWLGVEKPATAPPARPECPLDNERAAELIAAATDLSGRAITAPDKGALEATQPAMCGSSDPPAQNLWIGSLYGTYYVFRGDFTAGSTAEKVRRATITDIQTLPRK